MKSRFVKSAGMVLSRSPRLRRGALSLANTWHWLMHQHLGGNGKNFPDKRFQILYYHRVLPAPLPFSLAAVSAEDFERQILLLSGLFRIITIPQLLDEIEAGALQPNTICITFDDGYADNFMYAFPILKKYGVAATIFLTTGVIGNNRLLWHDQVLYVMQHTAAQHLEWPMAGGATWPLDSVQARVTFASACLESLKQKKPSERNQEIKKLAELCEVNLNAVVANEMLSWEQVKAMHHHGIAFGAHTVTHPILSLLDEDEMNWEILQSKQTIEERLKTKIEIFAYPNGQPRDFDERVKQVLKNCGMRCGLTTVWGLNTNATDPFAWRRATPWAPKTDQFFAQLLALRIAPSADVAAESKQSCGLK